MINKETAIASVETYLEKQNSRPNIHVFKIPVYNTYIKKLQLSFLKNIWSRIKNNIDLEYPEDYVKPNKIVESKAIEVIAPEGIEDLEICWSIPYCTIQYYETGEHRFGSMGGGPIFVDKSDGEMYQTGSAGIDWLDSFMQFKEGKKNNDEWPIWETIKSGEEH